MGSNFAQYDNIIPVLAPVDTAATAISTAYVDLKTVNRASFLINFGVITTGTADSNITVTVNAATVQAGTSASAIAFSYRLSEAVGSNAWGAVANATASGATIASTDDGKALLIDIDPSVVANVKADGRWVNVTLTPTADHTVTIGGAFALLDARYHGGSMVSAT